MAERSTAKAKRRTTAKAQTSASSKRAGSLGAPLASGHAASGSGPGSMNLSTGDLSEENARLKSELAAAHQRIADLEMRHAEVANRIDWVLDSLHNLPD